ncbi:hypothetical protein EGM87_22905 [Sphingobium sp. RSMS]|uniref:hypothetical protein n=1 Tax=Sphingobium sp. RSMS TaxID=520734 RepID=UPI0010F69C9E|nr:hypothetical protein [Sphingobium sp. RSMS]UXC93148.1 hypothetical protein EGM87_22905 [Sphingobium sp. RSMS]
MIQLDLFAPPPSPPVAVTANPHGAYPDDEAESFICPNPTKGWRGSPLCAIRLLHIEAGWLQATDVCLADRGGGHGLSEKFGGGIHPTREAALTAALADVARRTAVAVDWSTAAAHDAWRVRKWMEGIA